MFDPDSPVASENSALASDLEEDGVDIAADLPGAMFSVCDPFWDLFGALETAAVMDAELGPADPQEAVDDPEL